MSTKINAKKLHPIKDNVMVRVVPPRELITKSGLIITSKNRDSKFREINTYEVEILEVGPMVPNPENYPIGDYMITDVFAGTAIPTEGDSYIKMVPHSMLLALKLNEDELLDPTQLQANYERVIVKIIRTDNVSKGGVILPKKQSSIYDVNTLIGEVISTSLDVNEVVVGDKVVFEDVTGVPVFSSEPSCTDQFKILVKYDLLAKVD
jgi:co-chaperonin GroES (HSP10)